MKPEEEKIAVDKYDTGVYSELRTQTISSPQNGHPPNYMYDYNAQPQTTQQYPKFQELPEYPEPMPYNSLNNPGPQDAAQPY